jgi:hypothetical protein
MFIVHGWREIWVVLENNNGYLMQLSAGGLPLLSGANQADAAMRYGNQLVNVDWTTWGQVGQHLERSYYQLQPCIFYLHEGLQ